MILKKKNVMMIVYNQIYIQIKNMVYQLKQNMKYNKKNILKRINKCTILNDINH